MWSSSPAAKYQVELYHCNLNNIEIPPSFSGAILTTISKKCFLFVMARSLLEQLSPSLHRWWLTCQTLICGELPSHSRDFTDWRNRYSAPCCTPLRVWPGRKPVIRANTAQKAPNQAEQIRPRSKQSHRKSNSQAGCHLPVSLWISLRLWTSQLHSRKSFKGMQC